MIAITETWTDEDCEVEIEGYVPFPNSRNQDGGGVVILVRRELKYITTEVKKTKEHLESIWVVINNNRIKIRIGIVYFPQEKDQNQKEIYDIIKQQIHESRERDESIMIVGDFNSRVGEAIEGNNRKVSKGGKKLLKMIEKEGLMLVNGSRNCTGKWTREENNSKSILDYVVVDRELGEHIKKTTIHDEDKDVSPFHLKRVSARKIRTIYSDHNPIVIETDLVWMAIEVMERKKRTVMTKEGREKYNQDLQKLKISNIWDSPNESVQEMYNKWEEKVMETRKQNETVRKSNGKRKSKTMRKLMEEKKKLKYDMKEGTKEDVTEKLYELKENILSEEHESYFQRLKKNCEEISKDGKFNSAGFWKLKKRMSRRKEVIHAVEDRDGNLITDNAGILNRYGEYYEDLLTTTNRRTKLAENQKVVQKVERKFDKMMEEAEKQPTLKTEEALVDKIIKDRKKGKARDSQNWNNEMMKDGGQEMVKSIEKMADKVKERYEVPQQWNLMLVKSIEKQGRKEDLKNKRGLFLTNVVSKVFETIQDQESSVIYDPFQNDGTRGRGTIDS